MTEERLTDEELMVKYWALLAYAIRDKNVRQTVKYAMAIYNIDKKLIDQNHADTTSNNPED